MRQTRLRQQVSLVGALLLSAVLATAESTVYKIISAEEQFVVYSADPAFGQEAAISAEKIRAHIFSTLGWAGYSPLPAEIWISEEKSGENVPPALTSFERTDEGWKKKISTYRQPLLKEEILPREIVNLVLTEMANEKRLGRGATKQVRPPLWLVEGMRLQFAGAKIAEAKEWRIYQELPALFQPRGFSEDAVANRQFAEASGAFVHYLLKLPKGNFCIKDFVKRIGAGEEAEKAFYAAFRPLFPTPFQARLAWRDEVRRQLPPMPVAVREMDPEERQLKIQTVMDALDVE